MQNIVEELSNPGVTNLLQLRTVLTLSMSITLADRTDLLLHRC